MAHLQDADKIYQKEASSCNTRKRCKIRKFLVLCKFFFFFKLSLVTKIDLRSICGKILLLEMSKKIYLRKLLSIKLANNPHNIGPIKCCLQTLTSYTRSFQYQSRSMQVTLSLRPTDQGSRGNTIVLTSLCHVTQILEKPEVDLQFLRTDNTCRSMSETFATATFDQ
jgi:hypothetical protein